MPLLVVLNFVFFGYWLLKRKKWLWFPLLSLVVYFFTFNAFVQFNFDKKGSRENVISVLTYNARGFSLKYDISIEKEKKIIAFIKEKNPDILIFQEFSYFALKYFDEYPHRYLGYREDVDKSLQIILSKYPIVNRGYVDFPNTLNNAMFADIEYKGDVIRVYNLHLQSFGVAPASTITSSKKLSMLYQKITTSEKMRKEQLELVKNHVSSFEGKSIICGDFNSTPFSSTYKSLKKGRQDTFIEAGFGLGTTLELFGYPMRLDFILPDDNFEVLTHKNFDIELSDHEPIFAKLSIKKTQQ